jgi:hypothetical protein
MSDQAVALLALFGAPAVLGALFWLIIKLERSRDADRAKPDRGPDHE